MENFPSYVQLILNFSFLIPKKVKPTCLHKRAVGMWDYNLMGGRSLILIIENAYQTNYV
jgi:hypothetical protein